MPKHRLFSYFLTFICAVSLTNNSTAKESKLKASTQFGYSSILLEKGESFYDDDGAFLWDAKFDLWQTGFGVGLHHRSSSESGHVKSQRIDYSLHYSDQVFPKKPFQTDYKIGFNRLHYYNYTKKNANEFVLKMSWKKLVPGGVKPFYKIVYKDYDEYSDKSGFYHNWGISYGHKIPNLATLWFEDAPEKDQKLLMSADIAYYDGLGGYKVDDGFSHAALTLSTQMKFTKHFSVIPSIQHQFSFEDTVNDEDETAFMISGKYKF